MDARKTASGEKLRQLTAEIEKTAQLSRETAAIATPLPTAASGEQQGPAQRERESMEVLGKQQDEIAKAHQTKAEQAAKKQYDIMMEPWEDMAVEVGNITGDMFEEMLEKGKVSFGDLADTVSKLFRTTISDAIGNMVSAPLQKMVTDIGQQVVGGPGTISGPRGSGPQRGGGGGFGGFTSWTGQAAGTATGQQYMTGAAGGAAGGYVIGSTYSQVAGLKPGNQAALGGAIGGAAGAAIGTAIAPGIGTVVGATLGSMAGSAIGGLVGGENNLGNDRSAQVYGSRRRRAIYSDESFSQENRQVTQGLLDQVEALQKGLETLGGTFKDFNLRLEAGNKTGITVNGKKYANAQDALIGSLEFLLGKQTGGLTATQQRVLKTTKGETRRKSWPM